MCRTVTVLKNGHLLMSIYFQAGMRFYKSTADYVIAVTYIEQGPGLHLDTRPGIIEHKELRGESVNTWLGNMTESPVPCGLRVENWSQYSLNNPEMQFKYGCSSCCQIGVFYGPNIHQIGSF